MNSLLLIISLLAPVGLIGRHFADMAKRGGGLVRIVLMLSVPLLLVFLLSGDRRLLTSSDSEFVGLRSTGGGEFCFVSFSQHANVYSSQ